MVRICHVVLDLLCLRVGTSWRVPLQLEDCQVSQSNVSVSKETGRLQDERGAFRGDDHVCQHP